jgi:pullulanase
MRNKGKFLAFTERGTTNSSGAATGVDHLVRLGITHVHLLPSYDFASLNELTVDDPRSTEPKFNWGYDPMHYNVPEGSYSSDPRNPSARITEFKAMVQSLHSVGIRVVMDVVYNHTYQTGTWPFDTLVPGYYYRVTDTGAYADGSACGNEVASERLMVRKFIIDSCRYWANEYNVDGFRFDLMGLIDTPTMAQLTEELRREIDPTILIYGEPWQAGGSILPGSLQTTIGKQRGLGFAIFNDRIRGAIKGGSDDATKGFVTGAPRNEAGIVRGLMGSVNDIANQANESINYVTAHDNLNLWDKVSLSHGARELATAPYAVLEGLEDIFESNAVKSALLANGIILTSQGIPFFQAGDEMLRSKFGDSNSYASPDSVNKIRWENASLFPQIIDYYAGLIRLRKEHPAFRQNRKEDIERTLELIGAADSGISFMLKGNAAGDPWRTIFVAYNGSLQSKTFEFPEGVAVWHQVVDSRRAGVEILGDFSGSVTIPPLSMTVLYQ